MRRLYIVRQTVTRYVLADAPSEAVQIVKEYDGLADRIGVALESVRPATVEDLKSADYHSAEALALGEAEDGSTPFVKDCGQYLGDAK